MDKNLFREKQITLRIYCTLQERAGLGMGYLVDQLFFAERDKGKAT